VIHLDANQHLLRGHASLDYELNQRIQAFARMREAPLLRFFLAVDPAHLVGSAPPINSDTPQPSRHWFSLSCYVVGWRTLSEPVLALVVSGANFLLDVVPYRHSDAAQILGGRYTALCQALALISEDDFRTLYRPGFALLTCPSCQGRMRLLAVVKNPASTARYLAAAGELTEVPGRSPPRAPPYWRSQVLRRQAIGDRGKGGDDITDGEAA
jgi:hypothetical protein